MQCASGVFCIRSNRPVGTYGFRQRTYSPFFVQIGYEGGNCCPVGSQAVILGDYLTLRRLQLIHDEERFSTPELLKTVL